MMKRALLVSVIIMLTSTSALWAQEIWNEDAIIESATGAGNLTSPNSGEFRTFTFVAHKFDDGRVAGQWERVNHTEEVIPAHGSVTCMSIIGDEVYLGGLAATGIFSEPPENGVVWKFIDNGQGANADPDQMTLQFVNLNAATVQAWCDGAFPGFGDLLPVEAGNLKLHVRE